MQPISVVVTLFNQAHLIETALRSIQRQYKKVDEIVVIDRGSSDGGPELLLKMKVENLTILNQPGACLSSARKKGISIARNDKVAFLDAQNYWLPFFTHEIDLLLSRFPACKVFATRYQYIEDDMKPLDAKIFLDSVEPDGFVMNDYFDIANEGDLPFRSSSMVISKTYLKESTEHDFESTLESYLDLSARAAIDNVIAYSPNIHMHCHKDVADSVLFSAMPHQLNEFENQILTACKQRARQDKERQDIHYYFAERELDIAEEQIEKGNLHLAISALTMPSCRNHLSRLYALQLLVNLHRFKKKCHQTLSAYKKEVKS